MNFILRRVTSENIQSNEIIGKTYYFIYDDREMLKDGSFEPEDKTPMSNRFLGLLQNYPQETYEKIHGFILAEIDKNGELEQRTIPIYYKSKYYIMTESGKTFDTIKMHN